MEYTEAIEFLYGLRWFGMKPGLANTLRLAELAGNPHHKLRFIHVAGTNGKGSTCAMLEAIYRAAGWRVGLFTSPHLVTFGERIQVNRQNIGELDVVRLVREMQSLLKRGWGENSPILQESIEPIPRDGPRRAAEHPTFFEVVTIMALRYFAEQKCDLVIWETGLGGRLDATNIITPLASIITNIQYDHQKWLGETLTSIAIEKAGIIKRGVPIITASDKPEALQVIQETALRQHTPLTVVEASDTNRPPLDTLELPLLGRHQRLNAALAIATARVLASQIPIEDQVICAGLSRLQWPGRLQRLSRPSGQEILLDGAHNVAGAEILVAALKEYFPQSRPALILGVLEDKDWTGICGRLAPLAARIFLVPVSSPRTAAPEQLQQACRRANPSAQTIGCTAVAEALEKSAEERFVLVTGSLYLVGEVLDLLQESRAYAKDERALNEWSMITANL